jgi:gluconolactonase
MSQASPALTLGLPPTSSPFVTRDRAYDEVLGGEARLALVGAVDAHEGPVYVAEEDALYATTVPVPTVGVPRVQVKRIALDGTRFPVEPDRVSTVREEANVANGMTLADDGRLLVCEQGTQSRDAAITRFDPANGAVETLVDAYLGRRLNSPNDVAVHPDGSIWFTDPSYGHLQGFRPEPDLADNVYRFDPALEALSIVATTFDKPNGLAFSPDGGVLYVGDSGANHEPGTYDPRRPHEITAYDVAAFGGLENGRRFAEISPGFPDGIKVDDAGRVYSSSASGVQVFDPDGALLGEIRVPRAVNFTFGGPDRNVLYITADDAVWAAVLGATG